MVYTGRNTTNNVMHGTKIESVLSQVTRAIVKKGVENNIPDPHATIRPKIQNGQINAGETHLLNLLQQDNQTGSLPTYTNYWFAQSNPDYANQEENDTTIPKRRWKSGPKDVQNYLGNWMSADDLRRALYERSPNYLAEKTMPGAPKSMGVPDYPFSKIGITFADSHGASKAASNRRVERTMKAQWPRETI